MMVREGGDGERDCTGVLGNATEPTVLLSSCPDLPAVSAGWTRGRARSVAEVHAVRRVGKEPLNETRIGRGDFRRDR